MRLCRSEDGINTMIVRADHGDLVMVYALIDRLADILKVEGNVETADERRATAFGLLAQPAMILEMLLRHRSDGAPQPTDQTSHRDWRLRTDLAEPARPREKATARPARGTPGPDR